MTDAMIEVNYGVGIPGVGVSGETLGLVNQSGAIKEADEALRAISRMVFKQRFSSVISKEPTLEEVKEMAVSVGSKRGEIATLLRGWRLAFSESARLRWKQPYSREEDYWDKKSMKYYDPLDDLLWYGVGSRGLEYKESITDEDRQKLESGGYAIMRQLVQDRDFEGREDLVEFLKYDLWLAWRYVALSTGSDGQPNPEFVQGFERKKELLMPLFKDIVRGAAQVNDKGEIKAVFEGLDNVGAEAEADSFVVMEGLSDEERLKVAVEYINTFGFIRTIDLIASRAKVEDISDELRGQLKMLYSRIQGEEAREIAAELSEIYEKVDFNKYELNENELTKSEAEKIERSIEGLASVKAGKDPNNVRLIDVGAGMGRHALNLKRRGYKNVTALEYEQKHVDFMRRQDPELKAIKGDWSRLFELVSAQPEESVPVEFAYSLGRTIAHNRTPNDMFHLFDEVQRTLDRQGRFMFDLPDIDWGVYQERVNRLRQNLEKLGVAPLQSGIIFDGPNDIDRFNRMVLSPEQVKATAFLLGYKVIENRYEVIGDAGEIKNVYYTFEKDKDWDPQIITPDELNENLKTLGLLDPGTDYDTYVDAWGMTLGQALIYVHNFGLGNEYMRILHEQSRSPDVLVEFDGMRINLESRGISRRDFVIATATRGMSWEEVEKFLADTRGKSVSI